jgi:hypothetical protein
MKGEGNWEFDIEAGVLKVRWKIVAEKYQRDRMYEVEMTM